MATKFPGQPRQNVAYTEARQKPDRNRTGPVHRPSWWGGVLTSQSLNFQYQNDIKQVKDLTAINFRANHAKTLAALKLDSNRTKTVQKPYSNRLGLPRCEWTKTVQ